MPTGYTAGIIDGTTTSFEQYAKLCMRAFGATIHMRDDRLSDEYVPRTPSDYHSKAIDAANKLKQDAETLTDEEILAIRRKEIDETKAYCLEANAKANESREKLTAILENAKAYEPPTSEHTGIKDFMINQIEETIKWDAGTDYYDEKLSSIETELASLNAESVRMEMVEKANKDFDYHYKAYTEELERCDTANKWVEDFIQSLRKEQPAQVSDTTTPNKD